MSIVKLQFKTNFRTQSMRQRTVDDDNILKGHYWYKSIKNAFTFIRNKMKILITWMLIVVISTVVSIWLIWMTNNNLCWILLELHKLSGEISKTFIARSFMETFANTSNFKMQCPFEKVGTSLNKLMNI